MYRSRFVFMFISKLLEHSVNQVFKSRELFVRNIEIWSKYTASVVRIYKYEQKKISSILNSNHIPRTYAHSKFYTQFGLIITTAIYPGTTSFYSLTN
jgi:hypothetical protein